MNNYAVQFSLDGVLHVHASNPETAKATAEYQINQFAVDHVLDIRAGAADLLPATMRSARRPMP